MAGLGLRQIPSKQSKKGSPVLRAGDTLFVKNGTYVEEVNISQSGTANQPVTVRAYPGHKPVIDGMAGVNGINSGLPSGSLIKTNPRTGAGMKYTGLFDITGSYVVVDGFEIMRSMGRGMRIYTPAGRPPTKYVTVRNCNIHHSRQVNYLVTGIGNAQNQSISQIVIEDCECSWSGNYYPEMRGANSVTDWSEGVLFKNAQYCRLSRSKVYENWGEAIIADANFGRSHHIIIEDCIIWDNMKSVYIHAAEDVIFRRNYVYYSKTDRSRSSPFGKVPAIKVAPAEHATFGRIPSKRIEITNNIIVGTLTGIALAGSPGKPEIEDCFIAYNTLVNNSTSVLALIAQKKNMVFRNNIVVGKTLVNDAGGRTKSNWTYSNNLWSKTPEAMRGAGDVIGDPKLANINHDPAAGEGDPKNYFLTAASPAINAGFNLAEPKEDFFKNRRDSRPDIGGHEFGVQGPFIEADFDADPKSGNAPLEVIFTDQSSSSAAITSWLWDFGEETISEEQNPTHTFPEGTYTVSLAVKGEAGEDSITKDSIIIAGTSPPQTPPRVTSGLAALYRFTEGSGQIIRDVSGVGTALDLQIRDLPAVLWAQEGLRDPVANDHRLNGNRGENHCRLHRQR